MKKNNTIIGSTVAVVLVMLFSKLLGFVRQIVIAGAYGSNADTDIYFVSTGFMIAVSGALISSLTSALISIYIDISVKKEVKEANKVASKILTLFIIANVILVTLINVFAPAIAKMLSPSYSAELIEKLTLYIRIFSITFVFTAFQAVYSTILNANNSFAPGKLYGVFYNPITIVLVILFADKYGMNPLIVAYFIGNFIQTILLAILCKDSFRYKPSFNFKDETVKQITMIFIPILLSNLFMQLNGIVDKSICSYLGEGLASNYSYAYTLEQFITGTITATISMILLSRYATYVANDDNKMVLKTFNGSLAGLMLALTPIVAVTCTMAYEIVSIVYLRGEFETADALSTSNALIGFAIGFVLIAIREMYIKIHFSYQDTKKPMFANILGIVFNIVLTFILSRFFGILGVSLGTSLSVIMALVILNKSIKKYLPGFKFSSMITLIIKIGIATLASVLTMCIVKNVLEMKPIIEFVICALVAFTVYLVTLLILRCKELKELLVNAKEEILKILKRKARI